MCNDNRNSNYIANLLEKILLLQQTEETGLGGCEKPFLGNIPILANTRPLNLYTCCNGTLWTMPYNDQNNNQLGESSFFRIENVNDNCATFRILIQEDNGYAATNNFFMIDLNCISCIKCLNDTLINNL